MYLILYRYCKEKLSLGHSCLCPPYPYKAPSIALQFNCWRQQCGEFSTSFFYSPKLKPILSNLSRLIFIYRSHTVPFRKKNKYNQKQNGEILTKSKVLEHKKVHSYHASVSLPGTCVREAQTKKL